MAQDHTLDLTRILIMRVIIFEFCRKLFVVQMVDLDDAANVEFLNTS